MLGPSAEFKELSRSKQVALLDLSASAYATETNQFSVISPAMAR
jgi:hypothetical protein